MTTGAISGATDDEGVGAGVRAAVVAASVLGLLYALVSAYWTAGGTALVSTVGGPMAELAGRGGLLALGVAAAAVVAKLVGVLVGLVLLRRTPPRLLVWAAVTEGLLLTAYGGLLVVVGALALAGGFGPPDDAGVLRWHVLLWDMWFLLWGLLLLVAAALRRTSARRLEPAG